MVMTILLNVIGGIRGVPFCDHNLKKIKLQKISYFVIDFMIGQVQPEKLKKVF